MVFYFTSDVISPPVKLFMGLDKYESMFSNLKMIFFNQLAENSFR